MVIAPPGSSRPRSYIRIRYAPNRGLPDKEVPILELEDGSETNNDSPEASNSAPNALPPWAPFPSRSDFIFASHMVQTCASKKEIDFHLKNHHDGTFCQPGSSKLVFKTANALLSLVDKAVKIYPQVSSCFMWL